MVVAEDGAADDGQVCVAADEIVREKCDEIHKPLKRGSVYLHGAVLRAEDDAVLIIINIGGILQKPVLPAESERDEAVIFPRGIIDAPGVALRLAAELALGIARLFRLQRGGDGARVLFGLGEVDGYLQRAVLRLCRPA